MSTYEHYVNAELKKDTFLTPSKKDLIRLKDSIITMRESDAISMLRRHSPDDKSFMLVLMHAEKVKEIALKLSKDAKKVDLEFLKTGSLLHDIGRFEYPPGKNAFKHGVKGAEILRMEGLVDHARVAENHLGVGLTRADITEQKLDIPLKDYLPETREEKIICYADKLARGGQEITPNEARKEVVKRYGDKYGKRFDILKKEVMDIVKNKKKKK